MVTYYFMKILISIITSKKFSDSRLKFIRSTWLNDVENFCLISDEDDTTNLIYQATTDDSYESNVEKNFESFKILQKNFPDFDWYMNLDDDTFLNFENLKKELSNFSLDEIFILGHINQGTFPEDPSLNYCSGGAGYVFNNKTLKKLVNIDKSYNRSRYADVNIGIFCRENNIPILGCSKFNPLAPLNSQDIIQNISYHYIFNSKFEELYSLINRNI